MWLGDSEDGIWEDMLILTTNSSRPIDASLHIVMMIDPS